MTTKQLARGFTAPAHYSVEPNQYERELAEIVAPLLIGAENSDSMLAGVLSSHRSRIAGLFLDVFPTGGEPDEQLRDGVKFARSIVGPACPTLSDDPRGALVARLQREKWEAETEVRRLTEALERVNAQK